MQAYLPNVRPGLVPALPTLTFVFAKGIAFRINQYGFRTYIARGIAAHPESQDARSQHKIWRFARRAYFHATGMGAFKLGLVQLTGFSGLDSRLQHLTAIPIGAGGQGQPEGEVSHAS